MVATAKVLAVGMGHIGFNVFLVLWRADVLAQVSRFGLYFFGLALPNRLYLIAVVFYMYFLRYL